MSKNSISEKSGKRGLGASATVALMMLATVAAKGLGLFRQVLMASTYGTSSDANVFSVASQIPLQFFDLLFATAISGCFIPAYNSFKRGRNGEISPEADDFSCSFFNFIFLATGVLALLGILLASPIAALLGFESMSDKQLAAELMRIMFPMITSVSEVERALALCDEVKAELKDQGITVSDRVEIGIMIETPAAAIISDKLAKLVDFFSVGTNDLTQYTLACDRQNPDIEQFCDTHHEAILRLIEMSAENAHKNGAWIGICGELAADTSLTETFLRMGIDELSVSPTFVLKVRDAVRNIDLSK